MRGKLLSAVVLWEEDIMLELFICARHHFQWLVNAMIAIPIRMLVKLLYGIRKMAAYFICKMKRMRGDMSVVFGMYKNNGKQK